MHSTEPETPSKDPWGGASTAPLSALPVLVFCPEKPPVRDAPPPLGKSVPAAAFAPPSPGLPVPPCQRFAQEPCKVWGARRPDGERRRSGWEARRRPSASPTSRSAARLPKAPEGASPTCPSAWRFRSSFVGVAQRRNGSCALGAPSRRHREVPGRCLQALPPAPQPPCLGFRLR